MRPMLCLTADVAPTGGALQVSLRSWDSEWSNTVDVPTQQAVGTSVCNYVTLKQVRPTPRGWQSDAWDPPHPPTPAAVVMHPLDHPRGESLSWPSIRGMLTLTL